MSAVIFSEIETDLFKKTLNFYHKHSWSWLYSITNILLYIPCQTFLITVFEDDVYVNLLSYHRFLLFWNLQNCSFVVSIGLTPKGFMKQKFLELELLQVFSCLLRICGVPGNVYFFWKTFQFLQKSVFQNQTFLWI